MPKHVLFNEDEITEQKMCIPGPNVKFDRKQIPFSQYLGNFNIQGSLGCGDKYPRYRDGKYCCEPEFATEQEMFDYINNLLQRAIENIPIELFNKYDGAIKFLIQYHRNYLGKGLENKLELPDGFTDINDWYTKTTIAAREYKNPLRPYPEGMQEKSYIPPHILKKMKEGILREEKERTARELQQQAGTGKKRKTNRKKRRNSKRSKSSKRSNSSKSY